MLSDPAVLRGQLGRVLAGFTAFEVGNVAATLLILRATDILTPGRGLHGATQIGIALYVGYNIAATITSFPAGGLSDKLGRRGPLLVTAAEAATFLPAYGLFAISGPVLVVLGRPSRWPASASAAQRPPSTPRWPRSLPTSSTPNRAPSSYTVAPAW